MDYSSWVRSVERKEVPAVSLCCVSEPYLWDSMKRILQEDFLENRLLDFNYELCNILETPIEKLENTLETMPMISEKRVVVLENIPLDKDSIKKQERVLEMLCSYCESPNMTNAVFLHFDGDKPYLQGKYYKRMRPCLEVVEVNRLTENELRRFVQKFFQKRKILTEQGVVELVCRASGYLEKESSKTLFDVKNLLEQICSNQTGGKISMERAQALFISDIDENVFRLTNALDQRDRKRCVEVMCDLEEVVTDFSGIFYLIVGRIRAIYAMKLMQKKKLSDADCAKRLRQSPYAMKYLRMAADRYTEEELFQLHRDLYEVEKRTRTQSTKLSWEIMCFLMRACTPRRMARGN